MSIQFLQRNFFQRVLGIPATDQPETETCWKYGDDKLTVDLSKATELKTPGGAIRCEGKGLPERVLIVYGED